jgi:hypothetical protein
MTEVINSSTFADATVIRGAGNMEEVNVSGKYVAQCFDVHGNLKWEEEFSNLVTTQGKNNLLDRYLAGSSYTATWYLGLISATGYTAVAAGDTANSHTGWTEFSGYSQSTRVAPSFSSASSGSKATSSAAVFSISSANTIKGTFLISNSTKGGFSGFLYSAGLFTGGDKTIASGDVVNVTYTASA